MTTRTCGSARTIRASSPWSATRARSSPQNGGETWSSWYNQPTAQLYHVGVTPTFPYRVCAGQQESGSVCIASRGNDGEITDREWHPVGAIEYGYVAPDPLDPDVIYGAGRNEVSKLPLVDRPGAERHADSRARARRARRSHAAAVVFTARPAHALLRRQPALQDQRRRRDLAGDQSGSRARGRRGSRRASAALRPKGAEAQRGVIYALGACRRWSAARCGRVPMTASCG